MFKKTRNAIDLLQKEVMELRAENGRLREQSEGLNLSLKERRRSLDEARSQLGLSRRLMSGLGQFGSSLSALKGSFGESLKALEAESLKALEAMEANNLDVMTRLRRVIWHSGAASKVA